MSKVFHLFCAVVVSLFFFIADICSMPAVGISVGSQAPQIVLTDPSGKQISLSDLRGKIVLVDFWASWCGPCRAQNPDLVNLYNKYHNRSCTSGNGFEIFSISLDVVANRWQKAIADDNLPWIYHGCDFKGLQSTPAKSYRINQIPFCVVVDGNGKVIAVNLRGEKLDSFLNKLFSQK